MAYAAAMKREAELTYFMFVRAVDKYKASAAWTGAYQKAMDGKVEGINLGDHKTAASFADTTVQQVYGSSSSGDLPSMLRGNDSQRLFTMFMTQRNVIFNQLAKSVQKGDLDIKTAGLKYAAPQIITAAMLKWVIPALWNNVTTKGLPSDDKQKSRLAVETASYLTEGVPMANEVVRYAHQLHEGKGFSADISIPPLQFLQQSAMATMAFERAIAGGKGVTHAEAKAAAETAGVLFKLPGSMIFQMADYIQSAADGQEDLSNPLKVLWRLGVAGKEAKGNSTKIRPTQYAY